MTRPLFLDRDGVINKKAPLHEYIVRVEDFEFLPGAVEALIRLAAEGYEFYIISNQAGVARGKMSMSDVEAIHAHLTHELAREGVSVAGIAFCPHGYSENCECRKPKPGLILQLAEKHGLELSRAVLVGDSDSDMEAGLSAGITNVLLVPSEKGISAALSALIVAK